MTGRAVPSALILNLADLRLAIAVGIIIKMPPGSHIIVHAARRALNGEKRREDTRQTARDHFPNPLHKQPFLKVVPC